MTTEEWRPVVGHPRYEVSNLGRVRSLWRSAPYVLKPIEDQYLRVSLRQEYGKIHQLVAAAFLGPRPAGHVIRHLDGDSRNNRADNLAYGTQAENVADAMRDRTTCSRGHSFATDSYERMRSDGYMRRVCRPCAIRRARAAR